LEAIVKKKGYQTVWKENKTIDLHNDLLMYLVASPSHTPHDTATRSSIEQLRNGGVGCLVLTVFAETKQHSEYQLGHQSTVYATLHERYGGDFCPLSQHVKGKIATCLAIENCSTFLGETEPLEYGLQRLGKLFQDGIRPLYVSLTWNQENRCGGGAHSSVGLKSDGEMVLDALQTNVTAIDLSHASDKLASDVLNYLGRTRNSMKVIASHSNFRAISDVPRNLPDEIAQEIVYRGGVIGLTAIRNFIGKTSDYYYRHIEHALAKGFGDALAIGADFFCMPGLSPRALKVFYEEHFFPELADSSCLQGMLNEVKRRFGNDVRQGIAWKNAWERLLEPGKE
jgi:membrane dipeptidase